MKPNPPAAASALRVMSFNVWRDHPRHLPWARRRDLAAGIVRFHRPDVLGGQEFLRGMIGDFEARLPEYAWVGAGRDDGRDAGEFCPVFFRRDRLELRASGTFWLAPDPARPARGWDAACRRVVTWAHLRDLAGGSGSGEFFHFNTHFDHLGLRARRESAALLLRQTDALVGGRAALVTGDLNCRDRSPTYRILTGRLPPPPVAPRKDQPPLSPATAGLILQDARACCEYPPLGPRQTWRGILPGGWMALRFDYVFVGNGVRVRQFATLDDRGPGGLLASDHRPVVAEVTLPGS